MGEGTRNGIHRHQGIYIFRTQRGEEGHLWLHSTHRNREWCSWGGSGKQSIECSKSFFWLSISISICFFRPPAPRDAREGLKHSIGPHLFLSLFPSVDPNLLYSFHQWGKRGSSNNFSKPTGVKGNNLNQLFPGHRTQSLEFLIPSNFFCSPFTRAKRQITSQLYPPRSLFWMKSLYETRTQPPFFSSQADRVIKLLFSFATPGTKRHLSPQATHLLPSIIKTYLRSGPPLPEQGFFIPRLLVFQSILILTVIRLCPKKP